LVGKGDNVLGSPAQAVSDHDGISYEFGRITNLMRMALPENALVSREARECMVECVSEFISFNTSEGQSAA